MTDRPTWRRPAPARRLVVAIALLLPASGLAAPPDPIVHGPRVPDAGLCDPAAWPLPVDEALCDAARRIATDAAGSETVDDATLARSVAHHLRRSGVLDAHVHPRLVRAASYGALYRRVEALVADALAEASPEVPVLGLALAPARASPVGPTAVVLLARRLVHVTPFPATLNAGDALEVSGRLSPAAGTPAAWMGYDGGPIREVPLEIAGRAFRLRTEALPPGRHVLEILVEAGEGPEVALLAPIWVSRTPDAGPDPAWRDGEGDPVAAVHQALADHRRALGLDPPRRDPDLDRLAAARAEAMAARGRPVHRPAPEEDAASRLAAAGYPFAWAAEDLAVGPGALPAFQGLFDSPAHRRLLEHPRARRAGVGLAVEGGRTWLALLLADPIEARPAVASASAARVVEGRLLHRAEDAVRAARGARGLPAAVRDPALDALAADLVRHLAGRDVPDDPPAVATVRQRALDADPRAAAVTVDVVVAGRPEDLARARSVVEDDCDRLGLGVTSARSVRFAGERLWLAAVCAHHGGSR